jgi:hypothetical protein
MRKLLFIFNKPALNHQRNQWKQLIEGLNEGKYLVTIEAAGKRSEQQNAYYWRIVCEYVYNGLKDAGFESVTNKDDAHEITKALFLKEVEMKGDIKIERVKSTTELNKEQFSEYIDNITLWASDYLNIQIPLPNTQIIFYES